MNAVSPQSRLQHRCVLPRPKRVCVCTHVAVENVNLECEAVSQYAGKVECVECEHITLEWVEPVLCGSPERGMSGDIGNRFEVQGEIEMPPGQNLSQGTETIMDSSAGVLTELEVLHPGAVLDWILEIQFRNWILISLSASQELWGRAQMSGRRHWRVSLGLRTFLSTRVVWLAEWGLSVFRELWRRGGGHSTDWGLPDFREPWRRGGGRSTYWGLLDFREPWRKGGGRSQPPLRRDPLEPWRKGGGVM